MFFESKFTLRAECVIRRAHECAAELGHGYVGSEHLLLGLLCERSGRVSEVLERAGVTPDKMRLSICERTGIGSAREKTDQGLTPAVRRIIKSAYDEMQKSGNEIIGTEHLFLAILAERECVASKLLRDAGVDTAHLRKLLMSSGREGE